MVRGVALRFVRALAVGAVALLSLAACTPTSQLVEGSSVTVAVAEAFTSLNPLTGYGSAVATNSSVSAATNSSFADYDASPKLVADTSFGRYTLVSAEPFTVRYTIADGVRWSDGVAVDAADLLLAWVANSRALNDDDFEPDEYIDQQTGQFTEGFPRDIVWFDGYTAGGLQHATALPEIGADGRSLTMTFDEPVTDWQLMFGVGAPAHIVAEKALGLDEDVDADAAKNALVKAVTKNDTAKLAKISWFWNNGYNFTSTPDDPDLLISSGPYTVSEIVDGQQLTLTANPEYGGDHQATFAEIVVRFIADPLETVGAVRDGSVDVAGPQANADVVAALATATGIRISHSPGGTFEQLELRHDGGLNGALADERVRQAFLLTVPRTEIVTTLVTPLDPRAEPRLSHVFVPGQEGYADAAKADGPQQYDRPDIAEAKRLLGLAAADSPGLAHPTVCVLYDSSNPRRLAEFQLIRDSAALAGITVTDCSTPDWRELLGTPRSYDAALYGLQEHNLSAAAIIARLHSGSPINNSALANDDIDGLLARLANQKPGEREATLHELDAALWGEGYGMPLYQFPEVTAVSEKVDGVERAPFAATVLSRPWEWAPADAETE